MAQIKHFNDILRWAVTKKKKKKKTSYTDYEGVN